MGLFGKSKTADPQTRVEELASKITMNSNGAIGGPGIKELHRSPEIFTEVIALVKQKHLEELGFKQGQKPLFSNFHLYDTTLRNYQFIFEYPKELDEAKLREAVRSNLHSLVISAFPELPDFSISSDKEERRKGTSEMVILNRAMVDIYTKLDYKESESSSLYIEVSTYEETYDRKFENTLIRTIQNLINPMKRLSTEQFSEFISASEKKSEIDGR